MSHRLSSSLPKNKWSETEKDEVSAQDTRRILNCSETSHETMPSDTIVPGAKELFPVPDTQIDTIPMKRTKTKGGKGKKTNRENKLNGGPVLILVVVPSGQCICPLTILLIPICSGRIGDGS
jgi:hypothetical protein